MKRYGLWVLCFLSVALAVTPQGLGPPPATPALAGLMPAGPLLYLESPDFATLVRDWNASSEKKAWLESDNYQVFSRSRLFLRLKEAQTEFATAAGVPPDMSLLDSMAGSESALALYDVGNLEFLYVTRMPAARAVDNALWRGREKFEPRKVSDIAYYVRTEPSKNRLVAFATTGDYLLLATREDLMAGALSVIAGKALSTLKDERWFHDATGAAGPRGDLRLALNVAALVRSPHFRSYWIQRNVSQLRQYTAEVADVYRSPGEIREERVLLRGAPGGSAAERKTTDGSAVAALFHLVPDECGLYRAWSAPSVASVLDLLQQKVLSPRVGRGVPTAQAPSVALSDSQAGSEGDLESRIDLPPLANAGGTFGPEALRKVLTEARLEGALQLESARALSDGVFVGTQSAIVLKATGDWNDEEVRSALVTAVESLWTTSRLGVNWLERKAGEATYYELDGLTHLAVSTHGHILIVANDSEPVVAVLKRLSHPPGKDGGIYAAGFRHVAERSNLVKMMRLNEAPLAQQFGIGREPGGHEPLFFSENLASLSESLARVESESILVQDRGPWVSQTVTYRLSK